MCSSSSCSLHAPCLVWHLRSLDWWETGILLVHHFRASLWAINHRRGIDDYQDAGLWALVVRGGWRLCSTSPCLKAFRLPAFTSHCKPAGGAARRLAHARGAGGVDRGWCRPELRWPSPRQTRRHAERRPVKGVRGRGPWRGGLPAVPALAPANSQVQAARRGIKGHFGYVLVYYPAFMKIMIMFHNKLRPSCNTYHSPFMGPSSS